MNELSAHYEQISKAKFKFEKENKNFLLQIEDLRNENDTMARAKVEFIIFKIIFKNFPRLKPCRLAEI